MKGLLSLILGGLSFVIIIGSQINAFLSSKILIGTADINIVNVHWSIKMIAASIALIALAFSITYTKSGQKKMNIPNRIGRYLSILAVILTIIPVYQIFLKG